MTQTAFSPVTTRHSAFKVTHSASSLLNLEGICLYLDKYAQADCVQVSSSTWMCQFLSLQPTTFNLTFAAHCS